MLEILATPSTPRERRRTVNLSVERSLQLELPIAILLVTCAVGIGLAAYARAAFGQLFEAFEKAASAPALESLLRAQTSDFLLVAGVISVSYAVLVAFMTLIWCHRLIGPVVAFRRQLASLMAGELNARVQLRRGCAFHDLADDLNALAEQMDRESASSRA
ncbi:MAG TPA: hypothetical protein VNF72_18450 [Myxococcota bacterium]|jgi:hypothetical protein|nr:hypothetical protein [Myxococcota bacterium]